MKNWMVCRFELWVGFTYCPFTKHGPVYPMLKELKKGSTEALSLVCRDFNQLLLYFQVTTFKEKMTIPS